MGDTHTPPHTVYGVEVSEISNSAEKMLKDTHKKSSRSKPIKTQPNSAALSWMDILDGYQ